MYRYTIFRIPFFAVIMGASCFSFASFCVAQEATTHAATGTASIQKSALDMMKFPQREGDDRSMEVARDLIEYKLSTPVADQHPITLYPEGIGFDDLNEAFAFCINDRSGSKVDSRQQYLVVLQPGNYVGNFTLPPDTIVVGDAGPSVTFIEGKQGVNQPTLKANPPSGTTHTNYGLSGLSVIGRAVAAISFTGPNAASGLWINNCAISTLSLQAVPAVMFSGDAPYGTETGMDISKSDIESELGIGVVAVLGNSADFEIYDGSKIEGRLSAVDIQGNGSGSSDVHILDSELESESPSQPILRIDDVDFCRIERCEIGDDEIAGVDVISLSKMSYGWLDRSRIWCQDAVGVKLYQIDWFEMNYTHIGGLRGLPPATVGLQLTSANAYLYYTRIDATQDIVADPSSSYSLKYCD